MRSERKIYRDFVIWLIYVGFVVSAAAFADTELGVKTREIVYTFVKEFGLFFVPLFKCLNGCAMV